MISDKRYSLQSVVSNGRMTYGSVSSHSFMQNTNIFTYLHRMFLPLNGGNWFLSGNSNTTLTKGYGLYVNSTTKNMRFYTMNGAGYSLNADVSPTVPAVFGKWNNFLVRCDGTNFKMYNLVDGRLYQYSGTVAGAVSSGDSGTAMAINSYNSSGTAAYQGAEHSEFAIWNTDIGDTAAVALLRKNVMPSTPFTWFKFNDGSGSTVTDLGTGGNNGTIVGSTMRFNMHTSDRNRQAQYPDTFAGLFNSSSSGTISHSATYNPANMSVLAWVKWQVGATYQGIVSKTSSGAWPDGYGMYLIATGVGVQLGTWMGNWGTGLLSKFINDDYPSNQPPNNRWMLVGFTYDGTTLKQYVNGLLQGTLAVSSPATNTSDLRLATITGGYPFGTAAFANRIGRVVMTNVALTNNEVFSYYLRHAQPRGCIGDWRWTPDTTAASLKDYSSSNNPFVLTSLNGFSLNVPS